MSLRPYEPPEAAPGSTVIDITGDSALFTRFQLAIESIGMDERLKGKGPYTIFVPLDSAFDQLSEAQRQRLMENDEAMSKLISRHIVSGRIGMTDLMQMDEVETIDGNAVALASGPGPNLRYGGSEVVKGNLAAGNGIVHVVDRVLM
ncbi:fasciclin domain-containing protein [Thiorhodococcus minor]